MPVAGKVLKFKPFGEEILTNHVILKGTNIQIGVSRLTRYICINVTTPAAAQNLLKKNEFYEKLDNSCI